MNNKLIITICLLLGTMFSCTTQQGEKALTEPYAEGKP